MTRLKQSFHNDTNRPQIITLELSTARFRLDPGEVLVLHYDSDERQNELGAALQIDFIGDAEGIELVVWTGETEMYLPNGRPAQQNFDPV